MANHNRRPTRGFTVMEVVVALSILAVATLLAAQLATWSFSDRIRNQDRRLAEELAANVLESARACSWDELTPQWAGQQELPPTLAERQWKLKVEVDSEKSRPLVKRVTVHVQSWYATSTPPQPVRMTGLFSARSLASTDPK